MGSFHEIYSFEVMTSNVKIQMGEEFTTFCNCFLALGQLLNRKIAKMALNVNLRLKSYLDNYLMKIISISDNDR